MVALPSPNGEVMRGNADAEPDAADLSPPASPLVMRKKVSVTFALENELVVEPVPVVEPVSVVEQEEERTKEPAPVPEPESVVEPEPVSEREPNSSRSNDETNRSAASSERAMLIDPRLKKESVQEMEELVKILKKDGHHWKDLSDAYYHLGELQAAAGRGHEAQDAFEHAYHIEMYAAFAIDPRLKRDTVPEMQDLIASLESEASVSGGSWKDLSDAYYALGDLHMESGQSLDALAAFESAFKIRDTHMGPEERAMRLRVLIELARGSEYTQAKAQSLSEEYEAVCRKLYKGHELAVCLSFARGEGSNLVSARESAANSAREYVAAVAAAGGGGISSSAGAAGDDGSYFEACGSSWTVCFTEKDDGGGDGYPYYYENETGHTQWEDPREVGRTVPPAEEEGVEEENGGYDIGIATIDLRRRAENEDSVLNTSVSEM
jgi:tetratricopeptide (TPR) repeat protein